MFLSERLPCGRYFDVESVKLLHNGVKNGCFSRRWVDNLIILKPLIGLAYKESLIKQKTI